MSGLFSFLLLTFVSLLGPTAAHAQSFDCEAYARTACDFGSAGGNGGQSLDERVKAFKASALALRENQISELLAAKPGLQKQILAKASTLREWPACANKTYDQAACGKRLASITSAFDFRQAFHDDGGFISDHFFGGNNIPEQAQVDFFSIVPSLLSDQGLMSLESYKKKSLPPPPETLTAEEVRAAFKNAKLRMLQVIADLKTSTAAKAELRARLNSVDLQTSEEGCGTSADTPNKAQYVPDGNYVSVCGRYTQKKNAGDTMLLIMAHELGHSIDTCALGFKSGRATTAAIKFRPEAYSFEALDAWYPIPNLLKCLRSENSVRARPAMSYADDEDGPIVKKPMVKVICQSLNHDTHSDTIGESLADWFAGEALSKEWSEKPPSNAKSAFDGFARMTCEPLTQKFVKDDRFAAFGNPHPIATRRIEKLLLANPTVRAQMKCQSGKEPLHCGDPSKVVEYPNFAADVWPKGHMTMDEDESSASKASIPPAPERARGSR